ncbi:MAG: hypothetical protein L3K03_02205 [Thermoplasmata archaeon]|nr:hypothetical protein [Thermoplasmata archaeon]
MRSGLALHRWALLLMLGIQLIGIALLFVDPASGRFFNGSSSAGLPFSAGPSGIPLTEIGLVGLATLGGLAALILSLIGFLRWREGIHALRQFPVVSGVYRVVPPSGAARNAQTNYRFAFGTLLLIVLTGVALIGVTGVILVGPLHPTVSPNGTPLPVSPSQQAQVNASCAEVLRVSIVFTGVLLGMEMVLAQYVTQSLEGIVELSRSGMSTESLRSTRLLVYAGVALGGASLLNLVRIGLGAVVVVGPIRLLIACQRYFVALAPDPTTR